MIYLDNNATTRTDPRVVEVMLPYFTDHYGNAASRNHAFGWAAEAAVDRAREQVAQLISAAPRDVVFHTDAAQAAGKAPLDVEDMGIALLSLSAHKMYGPKGTGALYVRRREPRVRLEPMMDGGGHERGLRSGTLAVPLLAGFGTAC